jgi:hypothetical protein
MRRWRLSPQSPDRKAAYLTSIHGFRLARADTQAKAEDLIAEINNQQGGR